MDRMLRNKWTIGSFIVPALLIYTVLVMIPIVLSVYYSLFHWNVVSPMKFAGLDNFVRMFTSDDVFWMCVKNMLFLLAFSLISQQVLGFALAYILTGKIRGKNWFRNVFYMPAVISSVAVGMMWSFIYNQQFGLLNTLLKAVGLSSLAHPWLLDPKTAMWSISVVVAWQYLGGTMILFIAAIQNIEESIFESARIDGAKTWRMIWHITLPLVKPIIKVNTILISVGSLKFFDLIYVMTSGGPAHRTEVLASYIYTRSFQEFQYGYGDAMSVVLLAMCLLVTFIVNQLFRTERIGD